MSHPEDRPASPFRRLPPVHALLDAPELAIAIETHGRETVLSAVRSVLEEARQAISRGEAFPVDPDSLAGKAAGRLDADRPTLRPVINATGVLLHTGLGRAPLAREAAEAVSRVAAGYCNLEFDLEHGERGRRSSGVAELLRRITGAEAAAVVNNNAGATMLALRALAIGREVVVSRGQLVEIGGSYRLPEVFEASGARLREVGTTNKTRLADYERAIGPETAALLRVHSSNYTIVGFAESVGIGPMAALARSRGVLAIDEIGSGALGPGRPPGVSGEPTVAEGIAAGADLVLCSGDKLLGGPQCGLLLGRSEVICRIEADPMMRALRVDKMTLAALEATLRIALDPSRAARGIPLWAFLSTPVDRLRERADRLAGRLREELRLDATAADSVAFVGGGSAPDEAIPSASVRVIPPLPGPSPGASEASRALRLGSPGVVCRVQGGALWFDLRAVPEDQDGEIAGAIGEVVRG
ncbi:L-seryl-tRNA(Sec) selenium transferase [Tautonia sociabilis]|uniref:L-seryl-tRNA(Sec) selenium transferase n=1 Tax=Tautonia sociabilis TaxID=2080755 RepID=A0A432MLK0_9BACT|nr:L-seryl-tRNA(Sec) selenium transferase [Tautonia sociabilis]RUL88160.1 L-seryl-tRNA(Sec) selenium transferase [Tautonia sociabilis]